MGVLCASRWSQSFWVGRSTRYLLRAFCRQFFGLKFMKKLNVTHEDLDLESP